MNRKKVTRTFAAIILSLTLTTGAGFSDTVAFDDQASTKVYDFMVLTDTYDAPSLSIEDELDKLLSELDNQEQQSKVIYKYIKYRDQLEISNYYNPLEETLFRIGQDGYTINTLEDLDKLNKLHDDFNTLSRALLPLHYSIQLNNSKIIISDDYDRLLRKYKSYMLYEPLEYLKIMTSYEAEFSTVHARVPADLDNPQKLEESIQLLAKVEQYLKKPNKDFAFEHVKQAYRDLSQQIYFKANTDPDKMIQDLLTEIMPQGQMTSTYEEYLDLLHTNDNIICGEVQTFIDEMIGKQIRKLILVSE